VVAKEPAAGEIVRTRPQDNKPYNHIPGVEESCDGLNNVRRALERELRNPAKTITERGARVLRQRYREVQALENRLRAFLGSIGHGKWGPGK
jgi:hypothetical protein